MEIDPQHVINQLLEEVKRLTLENAALRALVEASGINEAEDNGES
jgi:hypothetical protein